MKGEFIKHNISPNQWLSLIILLSQSYVWQVKTAEHIGGVRQHEQGNDKVCNCICV